TISLRCLHDALPISDAVALLSELFERQLEAGENTRASLTYKKLARYATPTSVQKLRFGQILETSNRKLALETYESALDDLTKSGDRKSTRLNSSHGS